MLKKKNSLTRPSPINSSNLIQLSSLPASFHIFFSQSLFFPSSLSCHCPLSFPPIESPLVRNPSSPAAAHFLVLCLAHHPLAFLEKISRPSLPPVALRTHSRDFFFPKNLVLARFFFSYQSSSAIHSEQIPSQPPPWQGGGVFLPHVHVASPGIKRSK